MESNLFTGPSQILLHSLDLCLPSLLQATTAVAKDAPFHLLLLAATVPQLAWVGLAIYALAIHFLIHIYVYIYEYIRKILLFIKFILSKNQEAGLDLKMYTNLRE